MTSYDPVEFGRLQEKVDHLSDTVENLTTSVEKLTDALSEMKGGKKLLVTLATMVAAVSGGLTWLASHIRYTP